MYIKMCGLLGSASVGEQLTYNREPGNRHRGYER